MGSRQAHGSRGPQGGGQAPATLAVALGPQVPPPKTKRPKPALGAGLGTVPLPPAHPGPVEGPPQVAEVGVSPEHLHHLSDLQRQQQLREPSTLWTIPQPRPGSQAETGPRSTTHPATQCSHIPWSPQSGLILNTKERPRQESTGAWCLHW